MHRMYRAHTHTHAQRAPYLAAQPCQHSPPHAMHAMCTHASARKPMRHTRLLPLCTGMQHLRGGPWPGGIIRKRGITTRALRDAQPGVTVPCPRRSKLAEEVHAWPSRGQSNIEFPGQGGTTGRSRHRPGMCGAAGVGVATEEQPATSARRESFPDYSSRPRWDYSRHSWST